MLHPVRTNARINVRNVAAERVADHSNRRIRRDMSKNEINVGEIILKRVPAGAPLRASVAAPVGSHNAPNPS